MEAYDIALRRCSTPWAPWYVIPADRNWYRNAVIARILRRTLEGLDLKYPKPAGDFSKIVVEVAPSIRTGRSAPPEGDVIVPLAIGEGGGFHPLRAERPSAGHAFDDTGAARQQELAGERRAADAAAIGNVDAAGEDARLARPRTGRRCRAAPMPPASARSHRPRRCRYTGGRATPNSAGISSSCTEPSGARMPTSGTSSSRGP